MGEGEEESFPTDLHNFYGSRWLRIQLVEVNSNQATVFFFQKWNLIPPSLGSPKRYGKSQLKTHTVMESA